MRGITSCRLGAAVLAVLSFSGLANAAVHTYTAPGTFGNLDQNSITGQPTGVPANACVPTSVANGLIWLDNTYHIPGLIQGNGYPTIDSLIADMSTTSAGTTFPEMVSGTKTYISPTGQNVSPPVTVPSGQVSGGLAGQPVIQNSKPTAAFLYNNLSAGNAVEFWINWFDSSTNSFKGAHALTLTAISYDDTSGNGTLDFLDPFGAGAAVPVIGATFNTRSDGYLFINAGYNGGAANNGADPDNAVRSSTGAIIVDLVQAAPEPVSCGFFIIAAAGLAVRRARR
jgi:hypothetical protein